MYIHYPGYYRSKFLFDLYTIILNQAYESFFGSLQQQLSEKKACSSLFCLGGSCAFGGYITLTVDSSHMQTKYTERSL